MHFQTLIKILSDTVVPNVLSLKIFSLFLLYLLSCYSLVTSAYYIVILKAGYAIFSKRFRKLSGGPSIKTNS